MTTRNPSLAVLGSALFVAGLCTIAYSAISTLAAGADGFAVWMRASDNWGPANRELCIYGGIAATVGAALLGFTVQRCRQDRPGS